MSFVLSNHLSFYRICSLHIFQQKTGLEPVSVGLKLTGAAVFPAQLFDGKDSDSFLSFFPLFGINLIFLLE